MSAYSTHNNLAVRNNMEATRTVKNAENGTRSQHPRVVWKESAHRLRTTFYFAESFG